MLIVVVLPMMFIIISLYYLQWKTWGINYTGTPSPSKSKEIKEKWKLKLLDSRYFYSVRLLTTNKTLCVNR